GESILVFTHGGVLEMVYRHATGRGLSSQRDFEIPNAALNRVETAGEVWRVTLWAEVSHLERALDDLAG
ncbi:MAG TPA: histidine phosphatase family protein, partial [Burkholderiales bacterium]|nr:histidine phosphatase family protein [Burkholderiales bacterium]